MNTTGLILAGGQARRMGGIDKALIALAGKTLLAHCIARLAPQCAAMLLSANGDASRFGMFGIPVVADESATQEGPMAGILAALDFAARGRDTENVISVPVDTPFVPRDLVVKLHEARESSDGVIAIATSGDRPHHAVALWPVAIRDDMRAAFTAGERSLGRFAAGHRVVQVEWPAVRFDPFFNINTPADLARAENIILRGEF